MTFPVVCAVEGKTDEPIARRLLAEVGLTLDLVKIAGDKHQIDQKLPGWNDSAERRPWLVWRDPLRLVHLIYVALITDFSQGVWDPSRARQRSPSLGRALRDLDRFRSWIEQQ